MTFEDFQKKNSHMSYLVAKIHYNIECERQEKNNIHLVLSFTESDLESCESCSP